MTKTVPPNIAMVLMALLPGAAIQSYLFGYGVWINVAVAVAVAVAFEVLLGRSTRLLRDGSGILTAILLALALPPGAPVGIVALGVLVGLGVGKHAFGEGGAHPFNPAMVGYAALLVSFPAALADWPALDGVGGVDALTGATSLDAFKHRGGLTVADLWTDQRAFGAIGGAGWEWINAGYLLGGIVLLVRKVIDWRIPTAVLATLMLLAAATYDAGSSSSLGSPLYHCFTGATMLGAFFVATDPTTCAETARGRLVYGVLLGGMLFLVRSQSNYPDGVAFAVLLANAAAPLIDRTIRGDRMERPA